MGAAIELWRGPSRFGRRAFIAGAASGTAVLLVESHPVGRVAARSVPLLDGPLTSVTLIRPEDQLFLRFEFEGLTYETATNQLVDDGLGATPLVRVVIPRQHTSERAILPDAVPTGAGAAPINHRTAARSRLVFEVVAPLTLDVATLLDLASFQLVTTTSAGEPADVVSMIELPADLQWSPAVGTTVTADAVPLVVDGVSHLHRIVLGGPAGLDFTPVFNGAATDGFTGRLPSALQRDDIVAGATAGTPARATRMWLTALGAWAEMEGSWPSIDWIQRVQAGRDQFVQVAARGRLLPFGHAAVWTQTTTRRFIADVDGDIVATMVLEEFFSVLGDGPVDFPSAFTPDHLARAMPFVAVSCGTVDNIPAQKGTISFGAVDIDDTKAWRVELRDAGILTGVDARVSYTATDARGNPAVGFTLPAVFVVDAGLADATVRSQLVEFYLSVAGADFRRGRPRADVAWAPPDEPESDITTLQTDEMEFALGPLTGVSLVDLAAAGRLPLAPVVTAGLVTHPSLATGAGPPPSFSVTFSPEYLSDGNDPTVNPTKAFLDLTEAASFPLGGEARGVMTPDMVVEEFNQLFGGSPKSGVGGGLGPTWSPADAFGAAAELLRSVRLVDLVVDVLLEFALPGIDIPAFEVLEIPDRIVSTYSWCPTAIQSVPAAGFVATAATRLCIEIESVVSLDGGVSASSTVTFEITDFTLQVPPTVSLVELDVRLLRVSQPSSGATDLTFDVTQWRLGGNLSWVEPLVASLTPSGSDFGIEIEGFDLLADLELPLPGINLGVLAIDNTSITLRATFPFGATGKPRFRIGVGSPDQPVGVQLLQFSGGFSLELELSPSGLELLRIHFEVSYRLVTIDIVIAEAYCEVGVACTFTLAGSNVIFVGEIWLEASFSVLGIIGATLRISGVVGYSEPSELVTVSGTIYWSVTAVVTFSGEVPIGTLEFPLSDSAAPATSGALGGGSARPATAPTGSFGDVHTFATWNEYVDSFAPAA